MQKGKNTDNGKNKNINKLLNEAMQKCGVSQGQLEGAVQSGNARDILKNADPQTAEKLKAVLSDSEKTKEILQSPQAQALLKLFGGE